jgi:hypothetical protein
MWSLLKIFLSIFCFLFSLSIFSSEPKVIHIFVALCDNKNQGIVPVSERLGNGEDLVDNLYWGAAYGVKSFFKKDKDWQLIVSSLNIKEEILERVIFQHKSKNVFLVADAYRGKEIKKAILDLLFSLSGEKREHIEFEFGKQKKRIKLPIAANADLLVYVGHNGLMDFTIESLDYSSSIIQKPTIILACYSKQYFSKLLNREKTNPILWTNGLMAPEAYVLKAGIESWLKGEAANENAALAYHSYQKCGIKGARKLFSSDW